MEVDVQITESDHKPPLWQDVGPLMDAFMMHLQTIYAAADPLDLAAYALWRLNWIHPFSQGNGRTARAYSYFLLCHKLKLWLPGQKIIPEQIRARRPEYCTLLNQSDKAIKGDGTTDLNGLVTYLAQLLQIQLGS